MTAEDVRHRRLSQLLLTGGLILASMLLGLAGQALVAYYFGAGSRSDSLFLARDVGDLVAKALLTSQAVGVLVPFILALRAREGAAASDRALSALLVCAALAGTGLAAVVALAAGPLVALIAPGFDAATADRSVGLLRIVAPMLPFLAVSALAVGALQARDRFGRAMLAAIAGAAAVLVAMPPLVGLEGVQGAAAALTIGVAAQGTCAWGLLVAEGVPAAVAPWRERAHVAEFLRRTTPFLSYAAAAQGSGVLLRIAASLLGAGLYTAFSLAYRLYRAVLTLLLMPLQQVMLPAFSHSEASGRREDSAAELTATLRYTAFALVPVTVGLVALSRPVVGAVFERGAFSAASASATAEVLAVFALAILPTAAYILLEQAAYARRRTTLVVRVNLGLEVLQGGLYIPFVLAFGVRGIPLAGILGTLAAATVYLRLLRPAPPRAHLPFVARLCAAAAVMAAAVVASAAALDAALDPAPGLAQLVVVVPASAAGALTYLVAARVAGLREPAQLGAMLRQLAR